MQERRHRVAPLRRRLALIGVVAALAAVADQLSKTVAISALAPQGVFACSSPVPARHVLGPLWWALACNPGAAFSLGKGVTPVVEVLAVVLVAALALSGRRATGALQAVGTGLMLGGAVGNLVDRVARGNGGAVIDFIDAVRIGDHDWWPVFNVADSAIVVGAVALAIGWTRSSSAVRTPVVADA